MYSELLKTLWWDSLKWDNFSTKWCCRVHVLFILPKQIISDLSGTTCTVINCQSIFAIFNFNVPMSFECSEFKAIIVPMKLIFVNQVSYHWKAQVFTFPMITNSLQSHHFEWRDDHVNEVVSQIKFDKMCHFQCSQLNS